jgi:hypothetical protein
MRRPILARVAAPFAPRAPSSGGTVMWNMIERDVNETWTPEGGRLRLYVVTDGHDSSTGMQGMHPMMRALCEAGYDIEVRPRQ